MKSLIFALGLTLATIGMVHAATQEHDMSQHQTAMQPVAGPAKHEGVGVLKAAKAGKVQIAHDAIADLGWPPMTMWFTLQSPLPKDIQAGDTVRFELVEGESKQWVINKISRK